jgi:hypothetical protein
MARNNAYGRGTHGSLCFRGLFGHWAHGIDNKAFPGLFVAGGGLGVTREEHDHCDEQGHEELEVGQGILCVFPPWAGDSRFLGPA